MAIGSNEFCRAPSRDASPEACLDAKLRLMEIERIRSAGAPHILPDLASLPQPGRSTTRLDEVEIGAKTVRERPDLAWLRAAQPTTMRHSAVGAGALA